jgi:hypothetical protein
MIISYQQLSLSGSSRLTFGSAPQSAPDPDVRPLANAVAAIRALGSLPTGPESLCAYPTEPLGPNSKALVAAPFHFTIPIEPLVPLS